MAEELFEIAFPVTRSELQDLKLLADTLNLSFDELLQKTISGAIASLNSVQDGI